MKLGPLTLVVGLLMSLPDLALAHHSFAMFDLGKQVTLAGTVKEFEWTNPHAWIEVNVPSEAGPDALWSVQMNSPNNLTRQGWKRTTLKPGDRVTIIVNPMRDGRKAGLFYKLTKADGETITDPRPGSANTSYNGATAGPEPKSP
ncbi:MAG: DUF6152 family protein [Alphaproteobacteria bacterium]